MRIGYPASHQSDLAALQLLRAASSAKAGRGAVSLDGRLIDIASIRMAEALIEKKSGPFDPKQFHDHYVEALYRLIDRKRKAKGKKIIKTKKVKKGRIVAKRGVVVTQTKKGRFRVFSATCTHQGCPVDSVSDAGISCPCHGSIFDLSSGAPTAGPATSALGSISLAVDGDEISRA